MRYTIFLKISIQVNYSRISPQFFEILSKKFTRVELTWFPRFFCTHQFFITKNPYTFKIIFNYPNFASNVKSLATRNFYLNRVNLEYLQKFSVRFLLQTIMNPLHCRTLKTNSRKKSLEKNVLVMKFFQKVRQA